MTSITLTNREEVATQLDQLTGQQAMLLLSGLTLNLQQRCEREDDAYRQQALAQLSATLRTIMCEKGHILLALKPHQ